MAADANAEAQPEPASAPSVAGPKSGAASLSIVDGDDTSQLTLPVEITRGVAADAINSVKGGMLIEADSLHRLLRAGTDALQNEPTVIRIQDRHSVYVVGDLHGSLECLGTVLRHCDAYPHLLSDGTCTIVFNGDFVDRGEHSVEVLACLLLLKLAYPQQARHLARSRQISSHLAVSHHISHHNVSSHLVVPRHTSPCP